MRIIRFPPFLTAPLLPPVVMLRAFDTCRLIPSRFADLEDSVLIPLADHEADLRLLFDLDNATNERLLAEYGRNPGIGIDELVSGVPHFRIINAAFSYPRPEGSRFNGSHRGAWYCAYTRKAALAEVIFHKTVEYEEISFFHDSVSYQEFLADFTASFHDLRVDQRFADCLDPASYVASQALATRLLSAGSLGVVYPSVRRKRATNIACFRPAVVGNVRKGFSCRLTWNSSPVPAVTPLGPADQPS
ncbi:MAG: RES family NAD+ phosphorylase [Burkholderiaceae bacterium]